jgi:tape measure domain-containing protein
MANDISYVIKALDGFSKPIREAQGAIDRLNHKIKTNNNLTQSQFSSIRRNALATDKASVANKKLGNSMMGAGRGSMILGTNMKTLFGIGAAYQGWAFSKELFRVQAQMQSLNTSFTTLMPKFFQTGNASELAKREIDMLKKTSYELGVSFESSVKPYVKFLAASKMGIKTNRKVFESFAGLARLFNISGPEFGGIIRALEQMQSKGTVMAEELRLQLGDRIPGAVDLFAEAAGVGTKEFLKMMEDGRVSANILAKVADVIDKKYGKGIKRASKEMGAEAQRMGNDIFFLKETLSRQMKPAMASFIRGARGMTEELQEFLGAMEDKQAFNEMDDGMQNLVTTMRVLGGLAEGFLKALEGIKPLAKFFLSGIAFPKIALEGIGNMMMESEGEKYKQTIKDLQSQKRLRETQRSGRLISETLNSVNRPQAAESKASITVDFFNAPKGTKVVTEKETGSNLNLGYNLSYVAGGAY